MSTCDDIPSSEGLTGDPGVEASIHILAVDDDPAVRMALQRLLERAGYAVTVAANVSEALDALTRTRFDLIISDFRMPGRSGMDLLSAVQKSKPRIPFLLMSADGGSDVEEHAKRLGAFAFIEKPVPRKALLECASRALER